MKKRLCFSSLLIITVSAFCFSCAVQTEAQKNTNNASVQTNRTESSNDNGTVVKNAEAARWKTYKDPKNNFSFRYPPTLALQKKGGNVRLYHSIKFRYQDPCDERDNAPVLNKLIDFDIAFKVVNKDYNTVIREKNGGSAVADNAPNGAGEPANSQKKIDEDFEEGDFTEVGNLKGKFFWLAVEGCGGYEYVYPLGTGKSLVLRQEDISIFNHANSTGGADARALKNPNVISPARQNEIVRQILETVDF